MHVLARACAATLAVVPALTACGGHATTAKSPSRVVGLPTAEYLNPVWLSTGTLLVNVTPKDAGDRSVPLGVRAVTLGPGAKPREVHAVAFPQPATCVATDHVLEEPTDDGRVTMDDQCLTGQLPDAIRVNAVVADPRRPARVTGLAPLPTVNPLTTSWLPGLREGMVGNSDAPCSGLAGLDAGGPQAAPGPVTLDGATWRLDRPLRTEAAPTTSSCPGQGTATPGTFSGDGRTVLFFASGAAASKSGMAKARAPQVLFAARPTADARVFDPGTVHVLMRGLSDPNGVSVTRDGHRAVVAATVGSIEGLWTVDPRNGHHRLLAKGELTSPSISPDGREVVAVRRAKPSADTTTLPIYCLVTSCESTSRYRRA